MDKFVFINAVDVYDDKVFTIKRCKEWKRHMARSYQKIFLKFKEKIATKDIIGFSCNKELMDEVVVDAVIGMRKIIDSKYSSVEDPNAFKIISYLAYWFLRHKPIAIYLQRGSKFNSIDINGEFTNDEQKEYARQKLIWQLKHINELVAVEMVATYIFNLEKITCDEKQCKQIIDKENGNFCFTSFNDMRKVILSKLLYYFCYRALAPKMIEHMLEGYTLHPAWSLTGPHWASAQNEGVV